MSDELTDKVRCAFMEAGWIMDDAEEFLRRGAQRGFTGLVNEDGSIAPGWKLVRFGPREDQP